MPGGKIFDSLADYKDALAKNTVLENIERTVSKKVLEKVGLHIKPPQLLKISKVGGGVLLDLYDYEITDYHKSESGPSLEEDEVIDEYTFKSYDDIIKLCLHQGIKKDRIVGVLLSHILENK